MTYVIKIVIEGTPLSWKAPFVGSKGSFSPRYEAVQLFKQLIRQQYQGPVIECAVICEMTFYMPIPRHFTKKKHRMIAESILRPAGTPDRTNLAKLYEDCLQGIVIKNDSQIVGGKVEKFYGEVPRAVIKIEAI